MKRRRKGCSMKRQRKVVLTRFACIEFNLTNEQAMALLKAASENKHLSHNCYMISNAHQRKGKWGLFVGNRRDQTDFLRHPEKYLAEV